MCDYTDFDWKARMAAKFPLTEWQSVYELLGGIDHPIWHITLGHQFTICIGCGWQVIEDMVPA